MAGDPALYLPILIVGAFAAAFVIGAIGFADALILNAVWLHIMEPAAAIPLIVTCGIFMHVMPLIKLRKTLNFSRLSPFAIAGLLGVIPGVLTLSYVEPGTFRTAIAILLIVYGIWMLLKPNTSIGEYGGKPANCLVGFGGGFMGGFAGLSGLLPTIWVGMKNWPVNMQRGVFQPFVLIMHLSGLLIFSINGMITERTLYDLLWTLPVIIVGSWLGVKLYPYLSETLFRQIVLGLILLSGFTLMF